MVLDLANLDRVVLVRATLSLELRNQVIDLLRTNQDGFAWSHEDITAIDTNVITHKLNIHLEHKLITKKRRKFSPERNKIINDEVQKLIDTGKVG